MSAQMLAKEKEIKRAEQIINENEKIEKQDKISTEKQIEEKELEKEGLDKKMKELNLSLLKLSKQLLKIKRN